MIPAVTKSPPILCVSEPLIISLIPSTARSARAVVCAPNIRMTLRLVRPRIAIKAKAKDPIYDSVDGLETPCKTRAALDNAPAIDRSDDPE